MSIFTYTFYILHIYKLISYYFRLLSNIKINTTSDLENAIKKVHKMGPQTVAISSTELNNKLTTIISTNKGNEIIGILN